MPRLEDPPGSQDVEISLFGPGFGECVLVHLGNAKWLLVDSCVDQRLRRQPALEYLSGIGHSPASAVKVIVATHWHDDHVRGLAEVVGACEGADFFCSTALTTREVLTVIPTQAAYTQSAGAREFHDVLEILRRRPSAAGMPAVRWAVAERVLYQQRAVGEQIGSHVVALSPSDASVTLAIQAIGGLLPRQGDPPRYIRPGSPNYNAVVLWVRVGLTALLLGADLEETANPHAGWTVLVDAHERFRPEEKAEVFKVAHHGSVDAHQGRVWSSMLIEGPFALLTPFARGHVRLPTASDCERICALTSNAYMTGPAILRARVRRSPVVEKTMAEVVKERHELEGPCGHIRLRRPEATLPGRRWSVDLFAGALALHGAADAGPRRERRRRR